MNKKTEQVRDHILELINKDKVYHAILLAGDKCSTLELAKFLAKALVCKDENSRPCNKCNSCKKSDNNNHPDILLVSASQGRSTFRVDDVRFLSEDVYVVPNESSCKVYILKDAEDMTVSASNALLKLIEEPPSGVIFIITCESPTSLLPTVVSRCATFSLGECDKKEKNENACKIANEFLQALAENYRTFFLKTSILFKEKDRQLITDIVDCMSMVLDRAICIKSKSTKTSVNAETIIARKFTYRVLYELQNSLLRFKTRFSMNANKNILLTQFCLEIENTLAAQNK